MNNMEDRLRELGRAAREETADSLVPRHDAARRIRFRRGALVGGLAGLLLVTGLGVTGAFPRFAGPSQDLATGKMGWVPVASMDELEREQVIYSSEYNVFVSWNDGDPFSLSALVPHQTGIDERALYCRSSQTFDGPHGERFDELGYYFGGPARQGLGQVAVRVVGGSVQIDPDNVTQGPARAERSRLGPQGLLCAEGPIEGDPGFARERAPAPPTEAFALWPEDSRSAAVENCSSHEGWRANPAALASRFGQDVLAWRADVIEIDRTRTEAQLELRRTADLVGRPASQAAVRLYVIEVVEDCWSVRGVSRLPDKRPTGVGISVRGARVEIGFDALGAVAATVEIGYGGEGNSHEWFPGEESDQPVVFELDRAPETSGHFLILFRDETGEIFSAAGSALPAGDFAAG